MHEVPGNPAREITLRDVATVVGSVALGVLACPAWFAWSDPPFRDFQVLGSLMSLLVASFAICALARRTWVTVAAPPLVGGGFVVGLAAMIGGEYGWEIASFVLLIIVLVAFLLWLPAVLAVRSLLQAMQSNRAG